jgi:hypothetical protein
MHLEDVPAISADEEVMEPERRPQLVRYLEVSLINPP